MTKVNFAIWFNFNNIAENTRMGPFINIFRNKIKQYPDALTLFEGLKREESMAIRVLYSRIAGSVAKIAAPYGLLPEDIEELTGDSIAFLLLKIRNGQYVFHGFDPATYAIEVAKNKVRHFKKRNTTPLDSILDIATEEDYTNAEAIALIEKLLSQLPENCRKLITLKYLDEIRDKDVIAQQLTQYTTVDALKNHRAQCMKKLVALSTDTSF